MPKIVISGVAHAFAHDPRASEPLADNESFAFLHGMYSDEVCSEYLDEPPLSEIGIQGGRLRLEHVQDGSALRITTAYDVPRDLSEDERVHLMEATLAQWSDGIGSSSFRNHRGEILSTALAMASQNSDPSRTDLGEIFVDVYPFVEDRDVRIEFYKDGTADDELMQDLVAAADSDGRPELRKVGMSYVT